MTEYRIVKKHWRQDDTGEIDARFYPEYSRLTMWKKRTVWEPYLETHSYPGGGTWHSIINFKTYKEAVAFIRKMQQPVPADTIVWPQSQ